MLRLGDHVIWTCVGDHLNQRAEGSLGNVLNQSRILLDSSLEGIGLNPAAFANLLLNDLGQLYVQSFVGFKPAHCEMKVVRRQFPDSVVASVSPFVDDPQRRRS